MMDILKWMFSLGIVFGFTFGAIKALFYWRNYEKNCKDV